MEELDSQAVPMVVIEEDETKARRLLGRGVRVVSASLADGDLDLRPLANARALVANAEDERQTTCSLLLLRCVPAPESGQG